MTPNDFAMWLRGVIDVIKDTGNTHVNVSFIEEKLESVERDRMPPLPQFPSYEPPIVTGPLVPPYRVTSDGTNSLSTSVQIV